MLGALTKFAVLRRGMFDLQGRTLFLRVSILLSAKAFYDLISQVRKKAFGKLKVFGNHRHTKCMPHLCYDY